MNQTTVLGTGESGGGAVVRVVRVVRRVVALGGGGFSSGDDTRLDDFVLSLARPVSVATDAGAQLPRVCFVPTASGDSATYIAKFLAAFDGRAEASVLRLFDREHVDLPAVLAGQDVVYVGGGNTVNLLAVWRAHGLDVALRGAYDAGVVMAGISAGANCWFSACSTDSYGGGTAVGLHDGLGWLRGGVCPHYRSEPARRPGLRAMVAEEGFGPCLAVDDDAALVFEDETLIEVISARSDAGAFAVYQGVDGAVREDALATRLLA